MTKVLIVVDMLKDFMMEGGALFLGKEALKIIPIIKAKIEQARKEGVMVIFLCDSHDENDLEFKRFPKHAVRNTSGACVIDDLVIGPNDFIILKTRYSGFYNTNLAQLLQEHKVAEAELTGVCTHICVMDTAGGLANRDIQVLIDRQAVADFNQEAAEAALERMRSLYGAVLV